jgi:hypothetical protein
MEIMKGKQHLASDPRIGLEGKVLPSVVRSLRPGLRQYKWRVPKRWG